MSLNIKIINNLFENSSLLDSLWLNFENIPHPFQLVNLRNWWTKYGKTNNNRIGKNKEIVIALIYNEKELRGILPLMIVNRVRKKIFNYRTLEFFSQSYGGEELDIIHNNITEDEILGTFRFLRTNFKFDLIDLSYVTEDSILTKYFIKNIYLHSGKVLIPIHQKYEDIRKDIYSKNLRHVLNKFQRRIQESNQKIESKVLVGKNEIIKFKDEIKKVSLSKLLERDMHSIYQNDELGELYFNSIVCEKTPFCSVFVADNKLVSYNMGYIKDEVVFALDASYNREYSESQKIGLGILAYDNLVAKFSVANKWLDMGFGLDDYKFRFSKKVKYTKTLILKGNTLKSSFVFYQTNKQMLSIENGIKEKTYSLYDVKKDS